MGKEPPYKHDRPQKHMFVKTYQSCHLSYLSHSGLYTGGPYQTMLASTYQIGRFESTIVKKLGSQVHLGAGRYKSTIMCSVEASRVESVPEFR